MRKLGAAQNPAVGGFDARAHARAGQVYTWELPRGRLGNRDKVAGWTMSVLAGIAERVAISRSRAITRLGAPSDHVR